MIGPNLNDQSWTWLMGWARELDEREKEQMADDRTMHALDTAYYRGRHSVYKELMRLDREMRADEVATLSSTAFGHEV